MTVPPETPGLVGWVTLDQARQAWADAPLDDEVLSALLTAAYEECVAYAPPLALDPVTGEPVVPETYRQAQMMQARATYRAYIAGAADEIGGEGFTVTVFPLDRTVRQKLRPRQGRPKVR